MIKKKKKTPTTNSAKTKQKTNFFFFFWVKTKDKKLLLEKCNKMFIEGLAANSTFLYKVKAVVGLAILHD